MNIKYWAETQDEALKFLRYCEACGCGGKPSEDTNFIYSKAFFFYGNYVSHQHDDKRYFDKHDNEEFFFPTPGIEFVEEASGVNPKESIGLSKLPLHLWSPLATAYGSLGLLNGGKYGYGNYKATPVLASIYIAAIKRHLSAWEEGQECDEADGVPHLGAVLANVAILLESRAVGTMIDDRQISGGYLKEVDMLTKIANSVVELHKDRKPRHYTIKDNPDGSV